MKATNLFRAVRLCGLAIILISTRVSRAEVSEIAYSFNGNEGGGAATVTVDATLGKISDQRILFRSPACTATNKVRRTRDGQTLVVNNETEDGPHILLVSARGGTPQEIQLSGAPDEVRIAGNYALVTCADDSVAMVDLAQGRLARSWQADDELVPPGNKPEDIFVLPDDQFVVVSLQKDSNKGKKLGSRLVVLTVPALKRLADLRLPRTHPELHIKDNPKEQGPSPEIVLVSEPSNTLFVTLDLYGAVAVMDWDGAKDGKLANWKYLPTSLDGSWGTAFPDRAGLIQVGKRPCVLAFNAGPKGGATLVDLAGRRVAYQWKVPPGLEKPVVFPRLQQAFSVCSGKTKSPGDEQLIKEYTPKRSVYVFDLGPGQATSQSRLQELSVQLYLIRLAGVEGPDGPLLVLAAGTDPKRADTILLYDPTKKQVLDQRPAVGAIGQFEG